MTRARALASAVPSRVWTAIAGLVLLASLGVTLVLGAGLATWRGGVSRAPVTDGARPPITGTTPPGSAVVVVPTPSTHRQHPAQPPTVTTVAVAPAAEGGGQGVAPAPAPPVQVVVPPTVAPVPPVTAHPRVSGPTVTTAGHGNGPADAKGPGHAKRPGHGNGPGHAKGYGHVDGKRHGHARGPDGNQGKHLGWTHNRHAD